ncbi:hypothetical protein [Archangium violaceum]|uniref:Uncharacterized protein n=1 Tax=Archangium violaceum Cb vi76 TaxID=1406225 RepID=A0A084SHL5_9BACT|nr:hypothetical protein [Archangium violaceum]KFA87950.1 hypothetical protein Q664_44300 [Archangium violaceum Cb vi76]
MTFPKLTPLITFGLGVGLGAEGCSRYHQWHAPSSATYARQLNGQLTPEEKQLEAQNTLLGTAQSQLESQKALEAQYKAQLSEKDAAFEKFRQEHALRIQSLTDDVESLQQQVRQGRGRAAETTVVPTPGTPNTPAQRPAITYDYSDTDGRFHLYDPDIWVEGNETLDVKQLFHLKGEVFAQENGSLMTERLQLSEVVKAVDGSYREVAQATLAEAHFDYVNPPPPPAPSQNGWGLSVLLTVGPTFSSLPDAPWVRFGGAVNVFRMGHFGLAGGLSSAFDFRSEQFIRGTGGDVLVTWRPRSQLNLMLGGGVHLPLVDPTRVRPALVAGFVLY